MLASMVNKSGVNLNACNRPNKQTFSGEKI